MKTNFHIFRLALSRLTLLAAGFVLLTNSGGAAGNWLKLGSQAPDSVGLIILLSDGTVAAANNPTDTSGAIGTDWYALTPDQYGHYVNGNWTRRASMTYSRLFCASEVLPDGRLFVAGGEYGTGGATAEVYDPIANAWTTYNPPYSLLDPFQFSPIYTNNQSQTFSDANAKVIANGNVIITPVKPKNSGDSLIFNYRNNTWSAGPTLTNAVYEDESTWVKLPDGTILTIDPFGTNSERYIPSLNRWIADANLPVALYSTVGGELGPGFLLPNGKVIIFGGTGHTAIYTPSGGTDQGSWVTGPDIPYGFVAADSPEAMMPNGKILLAVAAPHYLDGSGNQVFPSPTSFFEYDYLVGGTGAFSQVNSPTGGTTDNISSYQCAMCLLPDGSVLYCHFEQNNLFYSGFGSQLYVYVPDGAPLSAGKPHVNSITPNADGSFHMVGTGLNGISEGGGYGDDAQMDGNYPIVKFTDENNNHADYGRTFNWSSTGVQTGNQLVSTEFTTSPGLLPQAYALTVSGAGLSSDPVSFLAPLWVDFGYGGSSETGSYDNPYKSLTGGVNAVLSGETVFIRPGHFAESLNITKPMFITALGGTATIGQ